MKIKKLLITILSDILIAATLIGGYSYYVLLSPKKAAPITLIPTETYEFGLPENTLPIITDSPEPAPTSVTKDNFTATALSELGYSVLSDKRYEKSPFYRKVTQLADDTGEGARFIINKVEIPGDNDSIITYYTVDLFVNRVTDIKTNVAVNEKGELSRDEVAMQADSVNAKLAISGDYFRNSNNGYIVRNGMLYRDVVSKNDYCILKTDGELVCVDGTTFESKKEIYTENVWQCWAFGPTLLTANGKVITNNNSFNINGGRYHSTDIANNGIQLKHPRSAIGYIDDGHYLLVLVDGRNEGYSSGATLAELSQIMYDEGCRTAYNLDGGRSAVLWYNGNIVNVPYKDGREISDILYIKEGSNNN